MSALKSARRFCSSSCQDINPHVGCPGVPKTEFDIEAMMQNLTEEQRLSLQSRGIQDEENSETVQKPFRDLVLSKDENGINTRFTVWDLAKWADEGTSAEHQADCCYSRIR